MEQTLIKSINRKTKSIFRLIGPSFLGVNRLFLSFGNIMAREGHTWYFLLKINIVP